MSDLAFRFRHWTPGTKISEPGAYLGVPMSVYHGDPCVGRSVSSSGLRRAFIQSPKHFWDKCFYNPERDEDPQTEFMILGRAAHHVILGDDLGRFKELFVLRPDTLNGEKWNGNRKDCKKWLADRELEGQTVLLQSQLDQVKGMVKSLSEEPIVRGGILNGHIEVSMFWIDDETGLWLKARPDVIPNDSGEVADLKCVSDISDGGLERGLGDHGYHQQGDLIREGLRETLRVAMTNFTLVYAESKRPHCIRFGDVPADELDDARNENRAALRLIKRGFDTGYWPGPKGQHGDGGPVRRTKWVRERAAERVAAINQELAAA